MHSQRFWDSCAQNNTAEIQKHTLCRTLGLLCAEQNVGNLTQIDFQEFWDACPQNRRNSRKSQKMYFQEFWDSCAQNKKSEISKMHFQEFWVSCAQEKNKNNVRNLKKYTFGYSGTPVRRTRRRKSQKHGLSGISKPYGSCRPPCMYDSSCGSVFVCVMLLLIFRKTQGVRRRT